MDVLTGAATVTVVVHQVDTDVHRSVPPGMWRWCVQLGGAPYNDHGRMLNAGAELCRRDAEHYGQAVGAAVLKALGAFGVRVEGRSVVLESDPIGPGEDRIDMRTV